ncbi:hypothetical protein C5S39_11685 [Candidatus Methanophagaceae archaeon]|nr:hypothetical protein C5S39_11685 [Methanophagales archaeon]
MQVKLKEKRVKLKEGLKGNILFVALPYTILISALTIIGLFGGFTLGNRLGSSIVGFSFSFLFTSLGFFLGVLITYLLVKKKYFMNGL